MPPSTLSPVPGFGAGTCCQPLPELRATTVSWLPLAASEAEPTSQAVPPEPVSPLMSEKPAPTPAGCCAVQAPLLRCSTSGLAWWAASSLWPTAHTWPPPTATACSTPAVRLADGTLTTDQEWPSQCSTSGRSDVWPLACPTAQMLSALAAATPYSWLPDEPGSGLGTTDQAVPSQCSISVL